MRKIEVDTRNFMYPTLTTLVGANVSGKPNYITIAHVGILKYATVSVSLNKIHYTNAGIKENGTFSVNIPSVPMIQVTDYCGLVSGQEVDKSALLKNFYGQLKTAPMIEECPANMECKVIQILDLGTHEVFIGEIAATYCNEDCLTGGKGEDLLKVNPILFSMSGARYFAVGQEIGRAWNIGKVLKSKEVTFHTPPPLAQE
ncbi:MAG: flavin reductase family protein [Proteobacteria bacterium]|nr:flavin reductase family protein [Pseudomonadota bacterium]